MVANACSPPGDLTDGVVDLRCPRLGDAEKIVAARDAEFVQFLGAGLELNRRLATSSGVVSIPDEIDPEIARLGRELNGLRVDRHIYDYVVQSL